jgi:hypothetical protein
MLMLVPGYSIGTTEGSLETFSTTRLAGAAISECIERACARLCCAGAIDSARISSFHAGSRSPAAIFASVSRAMLNSPCSIAPQSLHGACVATVRAITKALGVTMTELGEAIDATER